jgi:hypothetical protein
MRKTLSCLVVAAFVFVWTGLAQPGEEEGRALVAKAIKAMGGEEKLKKYNAVTWKEKGTYYGMGEGLPYTGIYSIQHPGQYRMEIEGVFTIVVNRDKGWIKAMGETKDLSKEQMASQISDQRAAWVTTLLPLADKAFTVTALGESKVEDRPALGVKVTRKDYPETKLFFDKKTHLLVKHEFRTKLPDAGFKEVTAETFYSAYREVDGVQSAAKWSLKHDGKLFVEAEITEMKAAGKLDEKVFERP